MNTLASKCFLILLALLSITPDHSRKLALDSLTRNELVTRDSTFLPIVKYFGGEPAAKQVMKTLQARDTLTTETFLLNILNSKSRDSLIDCPYYIMLGLFQLEIKEDTSTAGELFLLANLHNDQFNSCEKILHSLGNRPLVTLPVSNDTNFIRRTALIHNMLDSVFAEVPYSPRLEICLSTEKYCIDVPQIIEGYKQISTLNNVSMDNLIRLVYNYLPDSLLLVLRPNNSKKVSRASPKKYDHIPDYHPPERLVKASARDDLSEHQIAMMLLEDEKRRYLDNHKTFENIFYSCLFNYQIKRSSCTLKVIRISEKDLGLKASLGLNPESKSVNNLELICAECFVKSLNRFSKNNKIRLANTATKINVDLPSDDTIFNINKVYSVFGRLDMAASDISLNRGDDFLIRLVSPNFFRKDYAAHLAQIRFLQDRIKKGNK